MAKTTYLGANVEISTDSFGGWINKTNQLIYDTATVIVTVNDVAQPNTTNGAQTTGNAHIEGIFSANTISATEQLRGGTVSTPANLVVGTNTVFEQSTLIDVQANTELFNVDANNIVISSNVTLDGGVNKNFTATLGDITTTSTLFDITANTFNLSSNSTVDGNILNIYTTDLDVTANSTITAAVLTANVTSIDVEYNTFTIDGTAFIRTAQDIAVTTNTATIDSSSLDVISDSTTAAISDLTLTSNTVTANISFVDLNSTTIDVAGNTAISGTIATVNANTTINGTTVDINANTTITGSNVDVVGYTTVTGTTVVDAPLLDINANTTIDGSTIDLNGNTTITATNTDIVGSASVTGPLFNVNTTDTTVDGTSLVVNANTTVTGSTIDLNGNLTAAGTTATVNANTTINGTTVDINGTTTVNGSSTFNGSTVDVNANTTVTGSTLAVNANTTIVGTNTDIIGSASVSGSLFDVNATTTTVDGTSLIVNANTSISGSTVDVNGATTITGPTLTVGSNTSFNGTNVDINSDTDIVGDTTVTGNLDVTATSGTINFTSSNTVIDSTNTNITGTGANVTTNTLNVSANTTHNGRVTFNNNTKFAGLYANVATTDLVVGANSAFTASRFTANVDTFTIGQNSTDVLNVNSTVDFNSGINVDGNQVHISDVTVQGNLTVVGTTTLSSDSTISLADSDITDLDILNTITMNAGSGFDSDVLPTANNTFDLGSALKRWDNVHAGTFIGNLDWSLITSKPDPVVSVELTGDIVGSGSATLTDLTDGAISFSTVIQPNSVALGADTTGNYVQSLVAGTGITLENNTGESATPTISVGQNVATTSDVTFNNINVSEDVVVSGNLIVEGTTTTINTNEVNIGDNIILLNSEETGTPSQDAGFEVERGTSTNVSFLWDETADRWTLGSRNITANSFIGSLNGNADTASELLFGRTISLSGDLSGSVVFDGSQNVTLSATVQPNSVALGTNTTGNYAADVDAGAGINVSGSAGEGTVFTVSHADTSSQSSVNNSDGTVIQDVSLDTYGHITNLNSVNLDNRFVRNTTNEAINGFKTFANTTILQSTTSGRAAAKVIKNIEDSTDTPSLIVAGDGEASDVIAEFRANATGTAVDTSDTPNSLDSVFQILGTGNVNADGTITANGFTTSGNISGNLNYNDITNPPTIGNATVTISAGSGLSTGGSFTTNQTSNETITLNHADTSSQDSVNNSDGTIIQDITLDTYGHITGINSYNLDNRYYTEAESDSKFVNATGDTIAGSLTVQGDLTVGQNGGGGSLLNFYDDNSNTLRTLRWDDDVNDWRIEDNNGTQRILYHSGNIPDASITINAGGAMTGGGTFTTNQTSNETITVNHADTSSQGSVNNSDGTVIQDITLDDYGHITNLNSTNLDTRFIRSDVNGTLSGTLTVTGDVNASNFNSTSDERVKENVKTVDNALEKAVQMRGVYYNRVGESDQEVGVIAQEIEQILPEVVSEGQSGMKTVAYGNVVGLLIEAIKELKEEIDELKK